MKKIKVIKVMQNVEDKYRSYIKKLRRERDQLAEEVANQAQCNYAREPKFVKDRWRLRQLSGEVAHLLRQVSKPLRPIVDELMQTQRDLTNAARELEDESEMVIKRFEMRERDQEETQKLLRADNEGKNNVDANGGDHQVRLNKSQHNGDDGALQEFIKDYVQLRKRMHVKQTLANRLSSELACYENSWKSSATKLASPNSTTRRRTSTGAITAGCHSPIRRGKQKER